MNIVPTSTEPNWYSHDSCLLCADYLYQIVNLSVQAARSRGSVNAAGSVLGHVPFESTSTLNSVPPIILFPLLFT